MLVGKRDVRIDIVCAAHLMTPLVNSMLGCTSIPLTTGMRMSKTARDIVTARKTVASAKYMPAMNHLGRLIEFRVRCVPGQMLARIHQYDCGSRSSIHSPSTKPICVGARVLFYCPFLGRKESSGVEIEWVAVNFGIM